MIPFWACIRFKRLFVFYESRESNYPCPKDMVIFPICLEAHWFLIVAVKPGLVKVSINRGNVLSGTLGFIRTKNYINGEFLWF